MSVRIGLGSLDFPYSSAAAYLEWVDLCEEVGIDSLWLSERLLTTELRLEPLAALGVIAGRTRRLKFGTNVLSLPLRDPLVLATQLATLDYLSDGRLLPAFGVGAATAPEFPATGRTPAGRGGLADEVLQIVTRLWSEDVVDFEGAYFRYQGVSISPKPAQKELPVWIGGSSPAAIRRTARYGTGWLSGAETPAEVAPIVAAIRAAAVAEGRPLDPDHIGGGFAFHFGSWSDPSVDRTVRAFQRLRPMDAHDVVAVGADDIIERCRAYVDAGLSKFILRPVGDTDAELREQVTLLAEHVIPTVHALTPS